MSITHEQDVVRARDKIANLKESYMESIKSFLEKQNSQEDNLKDLFLQLQKNGNAYFNYVEDFVGNSDLLGAHENGRWVIGLAEDCAAILDSLIGHIQLLRLFAAKNNPDLLMSIEPDKTAYANMQRMVKKYLTKECSTNIKKKLHSENLPIYGFDNYRLPTMSKSLAIILSFMFGAVFIVALLFIAFVIPKPSDFQYTIFRIVLALAAGGVVAVFPGFIELKIGKWLRAGGALAVFVLVYFYSPAAIEKQSSSVEPQQQKITKSVQR